MTSDRSPVWFVTGCSTGFGRELARTLIARGWPTVVTARDTARVTDLVEGFEDNALALPLEMGDAGQISAAAKAAEQRFGRVDVLVNNAGYGYLTSIEEGDDAEIRAMFEANVFGLFALTRALLPGMRTRRRGHIFNITSLAGFRGNPGSGYYAATKHAVEGWAKSLAVEAAPFGIRVTSVAPGPFRTDWAGRSLRTTISCIDDYAETVGRRISDVSGYSGTQPGDPARAAEAIVRLSQEKQPPLHVAFGARAFELALRELDSTRDELGNWRELGLSTDFPDSR